MTMEFLEKKKSIFEKRLALLIEQYIAESEEHDLTLNPGDRVRLGARLEQLDREINKVEAKLADVTLNLQQKAEGGLKTSREFESRLPRLDYRRALRLAEGVFARLEEKEGGVLFLVQRNALMRGDWCLTAVRGLLDFKVGAGKVIPRRLGFTSLERPSEVELLNKLAAEIGAGPVAPDSEAAMQAVINKLCGSVPQGGALYVEVSFSDAEALGGGLLRWIVERFWCALADSLLVLAPEKPGFMVVVALVVAGAIPLESFATHLGCLDPSFDFKKILELPLEPWTVDDIRQWLEKSSGLQLKKEQCKTIAEAVYRNSGEGIPSTAHAALLDELERLAGAET